LKIIRFDAIGNTAEGTEPRRGLRTEGDFFHEPLAIRCHSADQIAFTAHGRAQNLIQFPERAVQCGLRIIQQDFFQRSDVTFAFTCFLNLRGEQECGHVGEDMQRDQGCCTQQFGKLRPPGAIQASLQIVAF